MSEPESYKSLREEMRSLDKLSPRYREIVEKLKEIEKAVGVYYRPTGNYNPDLK